MKKLLLSMTLITSLFPSFSEGATPHSSKSIEVATFAGGCFWCLQPPFDKLNGVIKTVVGYAGGHKKNPTYEDVTSQTSGHYEAIQVTYDPSKITYKELLDVFWKNHDPTDVNGQFCDRGESYRAAIFVHNGGQKSVAENSKAMVGSNPRLTNNVVTPILDFTNFYPAEEYHQDYYKKNPVRYKYYRWNCGRDNRLKEIWG